MTVIEAGPVTVRGPNPVPSDRAVAAVAAVDDELTLVGDELVEVSQLWSEVLAAALGSPTDSAGVVLVCPTWWTAVRCERVRGAVTGPDVVVVQRSEAHRAASPTATVIEIADEVVIVSVPGEEPVGFARLDGDDAARVADTVLNTIAPWSDVIVDSPAHVRDGEALVRALLDRLRSLGLYASVAKAVDYPQPQTNSPPRVPRDRRRTPVAALVVAALTVVALTVGAVGAREERPALSVMREGRVAMQIPAGWTVHRVTDGPGSARVQVVSPEDPQVMLHLTQSGVTADGVAETLRRALEGEPAGVFVDFDPEAVVGTRRAVSYREVRAEAEIRWVVFADGPVRIAIGCQSAPGHADAVRRACEAAAGSAHAVF